MANDRSGGSGSRTGMTVRRILRSLRSGTPVNKGIDESGPARRLPQLDSPILIGAAGIGAMAVGAVAKYVVPRRQGRSDRFAHRLADVLTPEEKEALPMGAFYIDAQVREAFGKPALVSLDAIVAPEAAEAARRTEARLREKLGQDAVHGDVAADILAHEAQAVWDELSHESEHGAVPVDPEGSARVWSTPDQLPKTLMGDYLERLVEAAWDNPEIAPVAVRARGIWRTKDGDTVVVDMRDLGYPDETARPTDLFDRYGPPASDPRWHP